jgi:hypothetical protein
MTKIKRAFIFAGSILLTIIGITLALLGDDGQDHAERDLDAVKDVTWSQVFHHWASDLEKFFALIGFVVAICVVGGWLSDRRKK